MNLTLYKLLPKRLTSWLMYKLARIEWPPLKNLIIRGYIHCTKANTDFSPEKNPLNYQSLNDFFTRPLIKELRPLETGFVSPVDGRCAIWGEVNHRTVMQAKNISYSLAELLASNGWAELFDGGSQATIYLAPDDYHRIHAPCDCRLLAMHFVSGAKHSVALPLLGQIPRIFAANERLVCLFDSEEFGQFAMVWVGALNVSSISTRWAGEMRRQRNNHYDYRNYAMNFARGEELGQFNLGSTVILLLQRDKIQWDGARLDGRKILLGQSLGR